MKIASFNINGIKARIQLLKEWLKKENPDIIGLQELKSDNSNLNKETKNSNVSKKDIYKDLFLQSNLLAYSDGRSLLEICEIIGVSILKTKETLKQLEKEGLLKKIDLF